MHLESELVELTSNDVRSKFNLFSGLEGESAIVHIDHAEEVEKCSFGEGTFGVTGETTSRPRGVVVSAKFKLVQAVFCPLFLESFSETHN